jgi:hypothetical protein
LNFGHCDLFGICDLLFEIFNCSYENTPKWHGFSMIKLAAFQASGWAET